MPAWQMHLDLNRFAKFTGHVRPPNDHAFSGGAQAPYDRSIAIEHAIADIAVNDDESAGWVGSFVA